ncbi:hypothetical protein TNCV_2867161 [Trichonephila clavipes]|nr:hypothetical protein TNCV_2867161 [Trichonephila clavipes]
MKTSSVEFISRSPTPSPTKSKQRRFVLLRRIFCALAVETEEKERDRFEQTFFSGLDEKKKEDVKTAYSQAGRLWHPAKQSSRAGALN